ncbi:MAG: DUF3429 domain-containing protein [Magnetovibrio sp.]|nr:DUF3429 domain-containing protein [Magnetovibrio sp.]|tara:strand:+ start:428 stop:865 length:438 start_codon:yes stop_codon:yes gene_type:complete
MPRLALWLGIGGLIPFAVLSISIHFVPTHLAPLVLFWLIGYGAVILSFLGGVVWGLTLNKSDNYRTPPKNIFLTLSVLPSLFSWGALVVEAQAGLYALIICFSFMLALDLFSQRLGLSPGWYFDLRKKLTFVVLGCFFIVLIAPF